MKRVISPGLFAAEGALLYLWQFQGQLAAGRILIFYLWALAIVLIVFGVLTLIGAALMKTRTEIQERVVLARWWDWATMVSRLIALVVIQHPGLAAVLLCGHLFSWLALSLYRDVPVNGGA